MDDSVVDPDPFVDLSDPDLDPDVEALGLERSQDRRHRTNGPAVQFPHPEVPDEPHRGPTIGLGPDDLTPYTHDERGNH